MNNYTRPVVEELSQNVHLLTFKEETEEKKEKKLYLVGTAHVSAESVTLVEETINEVNPDTICVELDDQRYDRLKNKTKYENINILELIRKKQFFAFIGQLLLGSFQKRISEKTGSEPGKEFMRAYELADEKGARLVLADRNIGTTLKRAWRLTRFMDKMKLLASLLFGDEDDMQELEEMDIEKLKSMDAINTLVESFAEELPITKKVLIDERDIYLTHEIQNNLGEVTVATVGAGHVPGMLKLFEEPVPSEKMDEINFIPPPSKAGKIIPWIIPLIIAAVFALIFIFGDKGAGIEMSIYWIVANGSLTAIGCILAAAHPGTIVAGFIAAPITSLNPAIGAGFVTAFVQAFLVKPRVVDFEEIQKGSMKLRRWWQNRVTKILIVFILSSIGSAIGTFVGGAKAAAFFKDLNLF
ncbi:MAG: TraB/GumN family protein [bacterium]|nr:TraB/GumN family protein [bacterium]